MFRGWLGGMLLVGLLVLLAVAGMLRVRRRFGVDVLKLDNQVAGLVYGVIGVLCAVVLGFTALVVWERFENAQASTSPVPPPQGPGSWSGSETGVGLPSAHRKARSSCRPPGRRRCRSGVLVSNRRTTRRGS